MCSLQTSEWVDDAMDQLESILDTKLVISRKASNHIEVNNGIYELLLFHTAQSFNNYIRVQLIMHEFLDECEILTYAYYDENDIIKFKLPRKSEYKNSYDEFDLYDLRHINELTQSSFKLSNNSIAMLINKIEAYEAKALKKLKIFDLINNVTNKTISKK